MAKRGPKPEGVETVSLADLRQDDRNARRHTPRGLGIVTDTLHRVGAGRSIVIDEDGTILAGNATVEAAADAGITKVHVVEADGESLVAVRRSNLTHGQKRLLALADNRAAEFATWDEDVLREISHEQGVDMSALWEPEEFTVLVAEAATPPEEVLQDTVRFKRWNVPLSPEDAERLDQKLLAYVEHAASTYGFAGRMIAVAQRLHGGTE